MTDEEKVLKLLERGKTITKAQALDSLNISHVGARICDLRKKGYAIETIMIPNKKKRGKHAVYRLADGGLA